MRSRYWIIWIIPGLVVALAGCSGDASSTTEGDETTAGSDETTAGSDETTAGSDATTAGSDATATTGATELDPVPDACAAYCDYEDICFPEPFCLATCAIELYYASIGCQDEVAAAYACYADATCDDSQACDDALDAAFDTCGYEPACSGGPFGDEFSAEACSIGYVCGAVEIKVVCAGSECTCEDHGELTTSCANEGFCAWPSPDAIATCCGVDVPSP